MRGQESLVIRGTPEGLSPLCLSFVSLIRGEMRVSTYGVERGSVGCSKLASA